MKMNKIELIKHQIVCQNVAIEQSKKAIIDLEAQLAEAEKPKPKLEHGDFGYDHKDRPCMSIRLVEGGLKDVGSQCMHENCRGSNEPYCSDYEHITNHLGNIFTLLKQWSEDLTYFEFDVHEYKIDPKQRFAPIKVAGTWHTLAEAEEFWRNLGQMIATLKRKQSSHKI